MENGTSFFSANLSWNVWNIEHLSEISASSNQILINFPWDSSFLYLSMLYCNMYMYCQIPSPKVSNLIKFEHGQTWDDRPNLICFRVNLQHTHTLHSSFCVDSIQVELPSILNQLFLLVHQSSLYSMNIIATNSRFADIHIFVFTVCFENIHRYARNMDSCQCIELHFLYQYTTTFICICAVYTIMTL